MMGRVSNQGRGTRDVQTVTATGESVVPSIDGVCTRRPIEHLDHRGGLFEIFNGETDADFWQGPVVYSYQASVLPGQIKGWARHEIKHDRYCLAAGELLVLLHDGRPDSPTHGVTQRVNLSPRSVRQLRIPAGVWHMLINNGAEEAHVINFPTERYIHEQPDRILLPWDSEELPVRVRDYLPKF